MKNRQLKPERGTELAALRSKATSSIFLMFFKIPNTLDGNRKRSDTLRVVLAVPLMREGRPIGVLGLTRSNPKAFTDKQIDLVTTFADQAVIAIENVRLFDEIQDKSRQLEVASQQKSQFLANMSHELRTPLNAILGYTELMADGAYGEPSEKMLGILKRLEANGRHLLGLINDVLDLSKIEAASSCSNYPITPFRTLPRRSVAPSSPWRLTRSSHSSSSLPPNCQPGSGDGRRLTQVLINLVGNAIKVDAAKSLSRPRRITASFHVSVRDTGPASPLPIRPGCFRSSSRPTMRSRARKAALAWGSPYPNASSRCTAAKSGSSRSLAKARRFLSHSLSLSSSTSSRHPQDK